MTRIDLQCLPEPFHLLFPPPQIAKNNSKLIVDTNIVGIHLNEPETALKRLIVLLLLHIH
jgi:hypothetical protein